MTPVTSLVNPANVTRRNLTQIGATCLPEIKVMIVPFRQAALSSISRSIRIDPEWPLDRWCSRITLNEFQVTKLFKNGFGSERNQMALRRRLCYRIQAFFR
jgi:AraC-like DNA-binding protein